MDIQDRLQEFFSGPRKRTEQRELADIQAAPSWALVRLTYVAVILSFISNGLTCWQASIYKDTTRTDLRAYMAFLPDSARLPMIGKFEEGRPIQIEIGKPMKGFYFLKNLGKTPAYNVTDTASLQIIKQSDVTRPIDAKIGAAVVCGSDMQLYRPVETIPVTELNWKDINNGERVICLSGRVSYQDIFGDRHFTSFCFQYVLIHGRFFPWKEYNDAN